LAALFDEFDGKVRAMGSHHSANAKSHVWLTPPYILEALGEFDLDPCAAPEPRPWPTAKTHWGQEDNSLQRAWFGRVWLNPPYGVKSTIGPWLRRMADHGQGTALIFARTETEVFFETVWHKATAMLFFKGRLCFYRQDGTLPRADTGGGNAGAPSVLVAYGDDDARRLKASGIEGQFVSLTG
jgi:DNA N-6-adenine-methyltransferase (Dam)